jgi:hypothetical protein
MERHEVPTVFVHGYADPTDVRYVEERLSAALLDAPAVRYSVLWIESGPPTVAVEIEAGASSGTISARMVGVSVRDVGDASIAELLVLLGSVLI